LADAAGYACRSTSASPKVTYYGGGNETT